LLPFLQCCGPPQQAARSLQLYLRARSRAACLPHTLTRERGQFSRCRAQLTTPKPSGTNYPPARQPGPGRHHIGTPGYIMLEWWARSSRNAWATSSESAPSRRFRGYSAIAATLTAAVMAVLSAAPIAGTAIAATNTAIAATTTVATVAVATSIDLPHYGERGLKKASIPA